MDSKPINKELLTLERPDLLDNNESSKTQMCRNFGYLEEPPRCYFENTSKEELVLEHVLEYKKQFKVIYDAQRKLLLAPRNEMRMRKFICTTIKPTKLPFTELYDWDKCAKFISNYLEYEQLEIPTKLPKIIPSPANVLEWQAGDSFDFSIVLCSLLIGTGYDAYVVYGTAPKAITTKDESLMECPFDLFMSTEEPDPLKDEDEEQMLEKKKASVQPIEDFKVQKKEPHLSKFDENKRLEKEKEEKNAKIKEETIDDDEPDYEKDDEFGRNRLHCWVMLRKGNRELSETFFVEPTTGRKYTQEEAPYFSIEAIFNNENYWINLDPTREIDEINLDFKDDAAGEWEFVMLQSKNKKNSSSEENLDEVNDDEDEEHDQANKDEETLDMPPPWSPALFVSRDKFAELCPKGEKTVFYKKC